MIDQPFPRFMAIEAKDPYSPEEARMMLDDHEARLANLEPLLPLIKTVENTWQWIKYGGGTLIVSTLLNIRPDTILGRIAHALLPTIF